MFDTTTSITYPATLLLPGAISFTAFRLLEWQLFSVMIISIVPRLVFNSQHLEMKMQIFSSPSQISSSPDGHQCGDDENDTLRVLL